VTFTRAMSVKVVATATGPDRPDALTSFCRAVVGQGGTLGGSRSMAVSGTTCISSVVFLPDDQAATPEAAIEAVSKLTWSLQTNLQDFMVNVKPASFTTPPTIFARVKVSGANRMGILAELADHVGSRSINLSTMRAQTDASRYGADGIEGTDDDEDPLYTAVITLSSHNSKEDVEWIEKEIYELADKMDVAIDFEKLIAE